MAQQLPTYDVARTEDGEVISIDVHGHLYGHDLDAFLGAIDHDPEEFHLDGAPYRGFNITTCLRSTGHPEECEDPDGPDCWHDWDEYRYREIPPHGLPARDGEVLVTVLEIDATWRYRCYNHRDRVAAAGLPAADFLPPGPDEAPDPILDGYLYVCRPCYLTHQERVETSRAMWGAEAKRRRAAGVPERLVYI